MQAETKGRLPGTHSGVVVLASGVTASIQVRAIRRALPAWLILTSLLVLTLLTGCVRYRPLPLATEPPFAPSLDSLVGDAGNAPLSVAEVTLLALMNNPNLRAARVERGLAQAAVAGRLAAG